MAADQPKLGIIAGGGELPGRLTRACRESRRDYFILALEGQADRSVLEGEPHEWIALGELGKGIKKLQAENVADVVFAGSVQRPSLRELRTDAAGVKFLARIGRAWMGDNSLLSLIVTEMERNGFQVLGADQILDEFLIEEGEWGQQVPDADARIDIERGISVLSTLGHQDVGQAVVVQQGIVLGIEAAEGTDGLIKRCRDLQHPGPGAILIKASKPDQERRIDLPTIGPATILALAEAGFCGVAVEAGGTLLLDRSRIISLADEHGLFVTAFPTVPG
jgi:hypothetical protein